MCGGWNVWCSSQASRQPRLALVWVSLQPCAHLGPTTASTASNMDSCCKLGRVLHVFWPREGLRVVCVLRLLPWGTIEGAWGPGGGCQSRLLTLAGLQRNTANPTLHSQEAVSCPELHPTALLNQRCSKPSYLAPHKSSDWTVDRRSPSIGQM